MTGLLKLLREPLVHFLVAGAAVFAGYAVLNPGAPSEAGEDVIVVDRAALLTFMQYRANAFEPDAFEGLLAAMNAPERQALIDAYVEEEILAREAQALGLAETDYIIRQRMIQKMRFVLGGVADPDTTMSEAALAAYFETNREAYAVAPSVTFTHVFLDAERRGEAGARAAAEELLVELARDGARFNDAPRYGDRFPFLVNYVERTFDYVASQFGQEFVTELARLEPSDREWQGPILSAYGLHLVLVSARSDSRLPALDDVRTRVEDDFMREASRASVSEMVDSLRERYRVEVADDWDGDAP